MSSSSLVLHYLNASRAIRILWLLEELNVPYELKKYQRTADKTAPAELKKIHPMGKAPILQDGSLTLIESSAIVEYLITKYGPQFKPSEDNFVDNLQFTHITESSLGSAVSGKLIWTVVPSRVPVFVRFLFNAVSNKVIASRYDPDINVILNMIEEQLVKNDGKEFLCGDHLTSSDFMVLFTFDESVASYLPPLGPKTKAYVERMKARPAYKSAFEKGEKQ